MHHLPSRYIPCDGRLTASAYFDPRSPHGERRGWFRSNTAAVHFNPRSPQGSDNRPPYYALYYIIFQPTLPVGERPKKIHNRGDDSGFQSTLPTWGATDIGKRADTVRNISIHAPRMGSDQCRNAWHRLQDHFNPRSPHGERLYVRRFRCRSSIFQSTLPAWGATAALGAVGGFLAFQSTLPAWGAT